MDSENLNSLLEIYGIDSSPDFSKLVKSSVTNYSMIPRLNTWEESHMLQEKLDGLDFAAVCMKVLNVNSATAYELGLVKVIDWQVADCFSSYINPVSPLSKSLRKSLPTELLQKIDTAPSFTDIWPDISHFFDSHVLYGSEASTRRLIYCANSCELDFSPVAMPFGRGPEPGPAAPLYKNGLDPEVRSALSYAVEWASLRIKSRLT